MTRMPALGGGDDGGGIMRDDAAQTFTEGDVSISTTNVDVSSGTVSLGTASSGTLPYSNGDTEYANGTDGLEVGGEFTARVPLVEIRAQPMTNNSGMRVQSPDGSTVYASKADPTVYEEQTFNVDIPAGTTFQIVMDSDGGGPNVYDYGQNDELTFETGVKGTSDVQKCQGIGFVEADTPALSGSVTVYWFEPPDIYEWDRATYLADPDAGAVTVDVVDAADGSVLIADVPRGVSLSEIPAATNVALRFSLSRSAPDDDSPDVRAAYRRWAV